MICGSRLERGVQRGWSKVFLPPPPPPPLRPQSEASGLDAKRITPFLLFALTHFKTSW